LKETAITNIHQKDATDMDYEHKQNYRSLASDGWHSQN